MPISIFQGCDQGGGTTLVSSGSRGTAHGVVSRWAAARAIVNFTKLAILMAAEAAPIDLPRLKLPIIAALLRDRTSYRTEQWAPPAPSARSPALPEKAISTTLPASWVCSTFAACV